MTSSSITSDQEEVEGVRKHPVLYDMSNTIYHQVAIFFLPNHCNLHEVSFVERFLDHLSFGLPSLCPCIRLFHWRSDHTGFHKPVRSKRKTNHASYVTKTKTNTTQVIKTLLNNFKLCLRLKYIFPHSVRFLSCKHHILFHQSTCFAS